MFQDDGDIDESIKQRRFTYTEKRKNIGMFCSVFYSVTFYSSVLRSSVLISFYPGTLSFLVIFQ